MRLNRAIASYGYCSRRKADECIFAGLVEVNGVRILDPSARVSSQDQIRVRGELINKAQKHVYLAMYKPVQVICSLKDPQGRQTVIDILPEKYKAFRLYPVGRLDYFSEGLLLLTNDGEFANRLSHPRNEHEKIYEVIIRGNMDARDLDLLRKGMLLEGKIRLLPVKVEVRPLENGDSCLRMTLKQGLNRQIRRIAAQFGWTILKLKRIAEAAIELGDLRPGAVRELRREEIEATKYAVDAGGGPSSISRLHL